MSALDYTTKNVSIKNYYKNKEIFVTGGSGFIGKALIEKIMRSCSGFSKIYVLIRDKKGKSADQRLQDLLGHKIFECARLQQPESFKKVFALNGDCSKIGLDLKAEDLKKLENINIIFHSAASVRFDDPLRFAILLNTRGTREMLKIAENLRKLEAFVHVSTTYCNAGLNIIEEKVYKPFTDWRESIKIAETMDEDILDVLFNKYSDFKPNTYVFTKGLSEQLVEDYKDKLPVLIYRPSVVVNCLDDPFKGWIDNFNGPSGMLMASGTGLLRSFNSDCKPLMAVVPIDIVVRGMIICAYKKGVEFTTKTTAACNDLDVYNCAIDSISPISTFDIVENARFAIKENPFEKTLWIPGGKCIDCQYYYYIRVILLHLLPALLLDTILRISGRKPLVLKIHRKIHYALNAIRYFIKKSWDFKPERFFALDKLVSPAEYDDFAFYDKSHIDYQEFTVQAICGIKEFLLKEKPHSTPEARLRLKILKIVDFTVVATIYFYVARFILKWCLTKVQEFGI